VCHRESACFPCTGAATRAPSCCSAWYAAPRRSLGNSRSPRPCSPKSGESRCPSRTSTSPSRPWPGWRAWFPGRGAVFAVARTAGWIAHALKAYAGGGPLCPRAIYTGPPAIIDPRCRARLLPIRDLASQREA
jgi:hypothetical protein